MSHRDLQDNRVLLYIPAQNIIDEFGDWLGSDLVDTSSLYDAFSPFVLGIPGGILAAPIPKGFAIDDECPEFEKEFQELKRQLSKLEESYRERNRPSDEHLGHNVVLDQLAIVLRAMSEALRECMCGSTHAKGDQGESVTRT